MSDALELIRAILAMDGLEEAAALQVLEAALEREVDVLRYCAATLGLGATLVMQRAAAWAGYACFDRVPQGLRGRTEPTRLEALADVRMFRVQLLDREIAFASPDFFGIIRLKHRLASTPRLSKLLCLVPEPALRDYLAEAAAPALIDAARQTLARRWPYASAHLELTRPARAGFVGALVLLVALLLLAPFFAQLWLLPLACGTLLAPAAIRLAALFCPVPPWPPPHRPPDEELPDYSVLIPLRSEADMVPQLFAAMAALDYPAERLDIKFVVEAKSTTTIAAVRARLGDPRFSLVSVPDALPRTKPKALDFALPLCRGEYVVVYDAEDVPDPDQLWKAALRFRGAPDIVCLQAKLVIDNGQRNWLTALFAGEYAGLFTVLLPALARWGLPMPLGGTSNHFRLKALRELGGWDAYNVTEDADLGMRLARRRMRVEVLDSVTSEAAPVHLLPWIGQRTRWMKGWMQTFIVHNRDPGKLLAEMGLPAMLAFEALVLGMIITPILHCGFAVVLLLFWITGAGGVDGTAWTLFYLVVLALGYGSAMAMTTLGLARLKRTGLLPTQLLLPLYWLLIGFASMRAAHELMVRPFYWFKSPHRPETAVKSRRAEPARPARRQVPI
ncbi:glycosyltransferase family 2 protein [Devosia ginsengisoli]|uniref:Glycosyltransferase n=1 Tax=Devosia ginsengisoli TaxID=400770 RepID=A0A5B8LY28_9HYPH|nr:glycosyltransferase family 2 protein [Devosia ginsengisoli]QDZ13043.1 glycosyltransferase [Devosia ginsengisoli]